MRRKTASFKVIDSKFFQMSVESCAPHLTEDFEKKTLKTAAVRMTQHTNI